MEKKTFLLVLAASVSMVACSSILLSNRNLSLRTRASSATYGISFSSSKNKLHPHTDAVYHDGNAVIQTNLGNGIGFEYYQTKGLSSTWQVLGDGGYFYNADPIHGIESIDLSFNTDSASYVIYYSHDNSFDQHVDLVSSTSSHEIFDFDGYLPNYIKILNNSNSDFDIASVDIAYTCADNFTDSSASSESDKHGIYSKTLKRIGTELMTVTSSSSALKSNAVRRAVGSRGDYAFVAMLAYWGGLLYQHDYYDSSDRIVKFSGQYHEGEVLRTIGFQTNISMDLETGFVTMRGSQGYNADHYYATVIMEAQYDMENEELGDFYIATTSLDANHNPLSYQASKRIDGVITFLEKSDETFNEFLTKLNPYIEKIDDAYLEEDEEKIHSYCLDYEAAEEFYKSFD